MASTGMELANAQAVNEPAFTWSYMVSHEQLPAIGEEQMLYVLAGVRPSESFAEKRLPLNLVLVVDRSTSMKGERLEYVKAAAHQILDELEDEDALGVVTFSDRPEIVVPTQRLEDRPRVHARISSIWTSGGTEIFQGLESGLDQARKFHKRNTISHVILLTDGHTYGDEEKCYALGRQAGLAQIGISALGIGDDWNDSFLEQLARQGGGTCSYISHPRQIRAILQRQVRTLTNIVARDLQIAVRASDKTNLESAFGCSPSTERLDYDDGTVKLGLLHRGSWLQVLLEFVVSPGLKGEKHLAELEMSGAVPAAGKRERLTSDLSVSFVDAPSERPIPTAIVNVMNRVSLFRLQEQAWTALEDGKPEEATKRLEAVATRLLDLGENELARMALIEANRVSQGKQVTGKGHKTIKYGTRYLGTDEQ